MDKKYIVALELSGTQIKGSVTYIDADTATQVAIPTICAIVSEDSADCVQYGRVQNLINAAKCCSAVLQKLNKVSAIADGKIVAAYVGLSGRSLGSEQASAMIELANETEITPEILKSLFVEASKRATPNKKVLRVLPRKYVVDNQSMLNPVGALGYKLRGDFTIVTCNPTTQRNLDMVLKERVGLNVDKYIVTPLALADMVLGEEEKQLGCVLIDLGAQTTTISIYKDRALQYLATLPIGSHNITRDISQGLTMTMERAETLKCTIGDALAAPAKGTDETSKINNYVVARAYELAVNIVANIGYAGYDTTALPGGIILSGRGSKLHNFDNLLANQSKMRVRHATIPDAIDFNLDRSIEPEDFMSLIAIVMRVSRSHNFANCVSFAPAVPEEAPVNTNPTIQQSTVQQQPIQQQVYQQPGQPVYQQPAQQQGYQQAGQPVYQQAAQQQMYQQPVQQQPVYQQPIQQQPVYQQPAQQPGQPIYQQPTANPSMPHPNNIVNNPVTTTADDNDNNAQWATDDPLPPTDQTSDSGASSKKQKKDRPSRGFLDRVKEKFERLMSSEGLEDDAQI